MADSDPVAVDAGEAPAAPEPAPAAPVAPGQRSLEAVCNEMFGKIGSYLEAKLLSTTDEYKLLQKMNEMTAAEYADMLVQMQALNAQSSTLKDKYAELRPYLDQIDAVEAGVSRLQEAATALDAYAKRLEAKYKELSK